MLVGEADMLEGLDAVDWASLRHAYGEASDVPGLLRDLASSAAETRKQAVYDLFGNIWHQGTVYSATAAAVPFLYELLAAPDVEDKAAIAVLLSVIADGCGYLEVHAVGDYGEPTWRKIFSKEGKTLEEELLREKAEIAAVRQAVSSGLPHLLPYLSDPDPDVRANVAVALGVYPEHAEWSLPAMDAAVLTETDEHARAMLQQSRSRLAR